MTKIKVFKNLIFSKFEFVSRFGFRASNFIFFTLNFPKFAFAENKWSGVDETVVEKFAEGAGRKAWTPFINTDQGDLLLFVFLLAGVIGGFILGYIFRKVFVEKADLQNVN